MTHLYFHLYSEGDVLHDPEGSDLPSEAVPMRVLAEARSLMAEDVLTGRIDLRQRIEVADSLGKVVHRLTFADAVDIILHQ